MLLSKSSLLNSSILPMLIIAHGFAYSFTFGFVNYMWRQELDVSIERFIVLMVLSNLFSYMISKFQSQFKIVYLIILLFIYIPIGVVSSSIVIPFSYFLIISLIMFISLLMVFPISKISVSNLYTLHVRIPKILLFTAVVAVVGAIIFNNASELNFNIFDVFARVYQIRAENNLTIFEAYSTRFIISICLPIFLWFYFRKGNYAILFVASFISLSFFQIFALKSQLYFFFLYFFIFYCIEKGFNYFRILVFFTITAFIFAFSSETFGFNFIDRFIYLPGLLNVLYLDYFSYNDFMYFEHSKLEFIFGGSEYIETVGYIIDEEYFGDNGMNGNTGFIGSMFAQVGYFGVFCALMIINFLILIFREIDNKMHNLGTFLSVAFAFELINAPLTNLLLSNGFIMIILIPIIFRDLYADKQAA